MGGGEMGGEEREETSLRGVGYEESHKIGPEGWG